MSRTSIGPAFERNRLSRQELSALRTVVPSRWVRTRQDGMKSKDKNAIKSAWSAAIAFTTFSLVLNALPSAASAKKPGATYCFNGVCHRVKTIEEVQAQIGLVETVG